MTYEFDDDEADVRHASSHPERDVGTWVLHGDGRPRGERTVAPTIPYSATFVADSADHFAAMATTPRHPSYYTRYGNPIHERVVALVAGLEGAESGLCFASGMAAISSVALGLLHAGDHVVAQNNHYMGTSMLLTEVLPRLGVTTTLVDQTSTKAFSAAIRPETRLVHIETPANPTLALTDIASVADIAHRAGALLSVDNTIASPINQRPLSLGADIAIHSATKILGGHHDITAGVIVASEELCAKIWRTSVVIGATLSPMDAWLLLRGLRTLGVRARQQNDSAMDVANFLAQHPSITRVHYPGLPDHPQHELAQRQMDGFGTLIAIEVDGGYTAAERFLSRLRLFTHAVSLGGVESLAVHAAAMWAGSLDEEQMRAAAINPSLVRLSIGLETTHALCTDLDQALTGLRGLTPDIK